MAEELSGKRTKDRHRAAIQTNGSRVVKKSSCFNKGSGEVIFFICIEFLSCSSDSDYYDARGKGPFILVSLLHNFPKKEIIFYLDVQKNKKIKVIEQMIPSMTKKIKS
jgi:hypothetical protein